MTVLLDNLEASGLGLELSPAPMGKPGFGGRCPRATLWKQACGARGCPVCGPKWARRQQTKIGCNLSSLDRKVATIAITGPGADVLPWDEEWCVRRHAGGRAHVHSGRRGCRVQQAPLREWCETLGWRWQKLRQAAQLATKRETGERAWITERVWEPQKRGVPHLHLVVPFGTPYERHVAEVFRRNLAERAADYGFGRVQPKLQAIEGKEAARYLANYLAGRTGKKSSIRENIADPRLPKSLLWETPVLSSVSPSPRMCSWRERYGIKLGTGVTMRTLRRASHLWALASGYISEYPAWGNLEEAVIGALAFRRVYPMRAGPAGADEDALVWARAIDRKNGVNLTRDERGRQPHRCGNYLRAIYDERRHEYVPNQPLFAELTRLAFLATRSIEGSTTPLAA